MNISKLKKKFNIFLDIFFKNHKKENTVSHIVHLNKLTKIFVLHYELGLLTVQLTHSSTYRRYINKSNHIPI